ncbi:branched-chain amino acid transport system II carrier protein [Vibrio sp. SM6]|uniref:Branched-chain amino acid transport system carrier protein n=1 Tax=Vibrio agarilyticus TaxID=2726741 RepID=A0A7X8YG46_9VIBR|nr:branched-chain amino acid transport system II carrier protein [Vibrio agarilyticus]NLS11992.1 branched-chain amino acid transport system II carrier protein [Vibrio agarilyticus]
MDNTGLPSKSQSFSLFDIIALGLTTFAFFLGAGNIIFPPFAGWQAGDEVVVTGLGFLLTAVGLPLLALIAMALSGGGWHAMTAALPKRTATIIAVLIFIIIGPAFAAPRAGLVAFEMGVEPFLTEPSDGALALFSLLFFGLSFAAALSRGTLLDAIGKWLTPLLFLALLVLAIAVMLFPFSPIEAAQSIYRHRAFSAGFLQGYNTMDTLAALMFGVLLIDIMKKKGVTEKKLLGRYLLFAALIAAAGLTFVYSALFYIGATSTGLLQPVGNGGEILIAYVDHWFGPAGLWLLALIIVLACFTTVVGLISACADYFSQLTSLSYRRWLALVATACGLVTNIGLELLIALSVPVLYVLYPVAICLIVLSLLHKFLPNPPVAYRFILLIALLFSLVDATRAVGAPMTAFDFLPLYHIGLAWLLPCAIMLFLSFLMPRAKITS